MRFRNPFPDWDGIMWGLFIGGALTMLAIVIFHVVVFNQYARDHGQTPVYGVTTDARVVMTSHVLDCPIPQGVDVVLALTYMQPEDQDECKSFNVLGIGYLVALENQLRDFFRIDMGESQPEELPACRDVNPSLGFGDSLIARGDTVLVTHADGTTTRHKRRPCAWRFEAHTVASVAG